MILSELKPGAPIILEVVVGSKKFEIPLEVERTEQFAIFTSTFRYGGNVIDFNKKGFEHLLFNIYASDSQNQGRFVWKGVLMQLVNIKGIPYYRFQSKNIVQQGASLNRRSEKRLTVDIPGQAFSTLLGEIAFVNIHDVSSQGISFYASKSFAQEGDILDLRFMDSVLDKTFDIAVEVQCVRVVPVDNNTVMYGCKVRNPGRDFQTFVCLKRLIEQKREKELFGNL